MQLDKFHKSVLQVSGTNSHLYPHTDGGYSVKDGCTAWLMIVHLHIHKILFVTVLNHSGVSIAGTESGILWVIFFTGMRNE